MIIVSRNRTSLRISAFKLLSKAVSASLAAISLIAKALLAVKAGFGVLTKAFVDAARAIKARAELRKSMVEMILGCRVEPMIKVENTDIYFLC